MIKNLKVMPVTKIEGMTKVKRDNTGKNFNKGKGSNDDSFSKLLKKEFDKIDINKDK